MWLFLSQCPSTTPHTPTVPSTHTHHLSPQSTVPSTYPPVHHDVDEELSAHHVDAVGGRVPGALHTHTHTHTCTKTIIYRHTCTQAHRQLHREEERNYGVMLNMHMRILLAHMLRQNLTSCTASTRICTSRRYVKHTHMHTKASRQSPAECPSSRGCAARAGTRGG